MVEKKAGSGSSKEVLKILHKIPPGREKSWEQGKSFLIHKNLLTGWPINAISKTKMWVIRTKLSGVTYPHIQAC